MKKKSLNDMIYSTAFRGIPKRFFECIIRWGLLILVVGLTLCPESTPASSGKQDVPLIKLELDRKWQQHWGDLEFDAQGKPLGLDSPENWQIYEPGAERKKRTENILWLKRHLSDKGISNAAIFLPRYSAAQAFEVYLGQTLIYRSGVFESSVTNPHRYILWHLIPLLSQSAGHTLSVRFYSEHDRFIGFRFTPWLGERNALMDRFVLADIAETMLELFFLVLGGFGFMAFIKIYHWHNSRLLSFVVLATFSGLYYLAAESNITLLALANPFVLSYLRFLAFFLFIAGCWWFFELNLGGGHTALFRFMRQCHVLCVLCVFPLGLLKFEWLELLFNISMISGIAGIVYIEALLLTRAFRPDPEAVIMSAAFGAFGLAGILDILTGLLWAEQVWLFSPWGLLVLLLLLAYLFVLRYRSELETLQAEALRSARLASVGELAAGVAHEINNPITGIIGYAEALADDLRDQGQETEIPERITKEATRVAQIVKNLLSFSRDQPREIAPCRIQPILDDALMLTNKLFQKQRIEIRVDIPKDLPLVMVDGHQIQQVFVNILNNARYALEKAAQNDDVPQNYYVHIQGSASKIERRRYVRIIFLDNGTGIPEKMIDKLCDPFFTTKSRYEGTGLGLSISHGIVNDHGGRLSFESRFGAYTKVIVELPISEDT